MAEEEAQGQDQSMEEILQSIKRIIAEDDDEPTDAETATADSKAEPTPEAPAEDASDADEDDDILELTDMVDEDDAGGIDFDSLFADDAPAEDAPSEEAAAEPETPEPEATAAEEPDLASLLEFTDDPEEPEVEPEPEAAAEEAPEPEAEPVAAKEEMPADLGALLSDAAANQTAAAFQELANVAHDKEDEPAPTLTESPVFRSGTTIEDLVLEGLRPLIKEWLDDNLPDMVRRMVKREIEKLLPR